MTTAIVLAAGASTRFGSQKLLADLQGEPVVRRAVRHVLDAKPDHVIVVVGCQGEAVRTALDGCGVRVVVNALWREGIGSSLRCGIAASSGSSTAAMIALGDQPCARSADMRALIAAHATAESRITVPRYRGVRGHPVIFASELFDELLTVRGDRGARDIIARDPARVCVVDFDAPAPADVDTPEALQALLESR